MNFQPSSEDLSNLTVRHYDENAEAFCSQTMALDLSHLYEPFLDRLPAGAHILDAGCGSGRDSLAFREAGFHVTAFDASEKMVEQSSKLLGDPVLQLRFEEIAFNQQFDGIWACASLLHVPRVQMPDVLSRLAAALHPTGVLYASFKLKSGPGEEFVRGRFFNSYDEGSLRALIASIPELHVVQCWETQDARPEKSSERWINLLVSKQPVLRK